MFSPQGSFGPDLSGLNNLNLFGGGGFDIQPQKKEEEIKDVKLERLGTQEEQAQRAKLARDLMVQQQAAQRQLASQQARSGMRSAASAAQQARLARQIEQGRSVQEEEGQLQRRMFNLQQAQREQFANLAKQLALKQMATALEGQKLMAQAAREGGQAQVKAAQAAAEPQGLLGWLFG